jgi:hypothetical protein
MESEHYLYIVVTPMKKALNLTSHFFDRCSELPKISDTLSVYLYELCSLQQRTVGALQRSDWHRSRTTTFHRWVSGRTEEIVDSPKHFKYCCLVFVRF